MLKPSGWDRIGIILSGACIIHCMVFPLISASVLIAGVGLGTEDLTHRVLFLLLAATGLLAFIPGMRKHKDKRVLAVAGIGFIIISCVAVMGDTYFSHGSLVNIIGSLFLISAHLWNHKLKQNDHCCDHAD